MKQSWQDSGGQEWCRGSAVALRTLHSKGELLTGAIGVDAIRDRAVYLFKIFSVKLEVKVRGPCLLFIV